MGTSLLYSWKMLREASKRLLVSLRLQRLIHPRRLRSGTTATTGHVSVSYFREARTAPILLGAAALPGGADPNLDPGLQYVYGRVMECLGSMTNDRYFVGLVEEIHQAKTLVSAP
jgi:hypothetical protein